MKYFRLITLVLILFTSIANATVWIMIADPSQKKIGAVGMSSGLIGKNTFALVDNVGMTASGSWYVYGAQRRLSPILSQNLSTSEMMYALSREANRKKGEYPRRMTLIRSNFEAASLAGKGCHSENYFCGEVVGKHYAITGGGLTGPENLTETAKLIEYNLTTNMPLECQLEAAMQKLAMVGGEWKLFERLLFAVDDLTRRRDADYKVFHRKDRWEGELNQDLRDYIQKKKKITCKSLYE